MKTAFITLLSLAALASTARAEGDITLSTDYVYTFSVTQGGKCWADDYSFQFMIEPSDAISNGTVLAAYWGNVNNGYGNTPDYNSNAVVFNVGGDGSITLQIGRGELSGLNTGNASSFVLSDTTTMNFRDSLTFSTALQTGVVYTVSVTGGDQAMTPTLSWQGGSETLASYKGNMNGSINDGAVGASLNTSFNQNFTVPEPATATLSLLALAGLAVRRRRRTV